MEHGINITVLCSRQAKLTVSCVEEATSSCSDYHRNVFAMITTAIESTISTSCTADTCNLATAEHCISEAYQQLTAPVYTDGGSILTCR